MAGTRLKLIVVYSTQVISLIALGFYVAIQNSYSEEISNKWSRIHHQLITDSRGLAHLHSRLNGIDIISLLHQIRTDHYDINQVELHVINHGGFHSDGVKENEQHELIRHALQRGLNDHDNLQNVMAFPVTVTSSTNREIDKRLLNCRILDFLKESSSHLENTRKKHTTTEHSFNYPMHILHNCYVDDDSKIRVDINDFGTIIVRFAKKMSWLEKMAAFEHSIPEFLSSWLQPSSLTSNPESLLRAQNEFSHASMKVISTLIDADPISYADTMKKDESVTPLSHYQLLSTIFQNEMTSSIHSIINKLSTRGAKWNDDDNQTLGLYQSTNLHLHGITYVGQDLVTKAILNEYEENIPSDYTIPLKIANDLVNNGEIGQSIGLHDGTNIVADSDDTIDENVWNLVFFVPPKASTPLYIQSDVDDGSSWSPAIAITRMNTIFSIVNINHSEDQTDNMEEYYQFAIRQSISYVGSHIRTKLGLSSIPLDAQGKQSFNGDLTVAYHYALSTSYGVSPWEIELLIRLSWEIKVEKIIKSIEELVTLTRTRESIAFPIEVSLYFILFL